MEKNDTIRKVELNKLTPEQLEASIRKVSDIIIKKLNTLDKDANDLLNKYGIGAVLEIKFGKQEEIEKLKLDSKKD